MPSASAIFSPRASGSLLATRTISYGQSGRREWNSSDDIVVPLPDSITATRAFAAIVACLRAARARGTGARLNRPSPARMRPVFQPSPEDWPYLRRLGWTILAAATIVVLWRASNMLLLAFGSVLGAVMFRSAGRMFQQLGVRNWKAALALGTLLVLALFGVIAYLLVVQFGSEISGMIGNLPGTIASVEHGLQTTKVGRAVVEATHVGVGGDAIAKRLGQLMLGGGVMLINFVIVTVGALFIAADPRPYRSAIILLTPPPGRAAMEHALGEISAALRLWLKAKLFAMVAMTAVISGALWLAGLKSWAALGLLGGLSEFVPYVGPTVAMVPAFGLAAAGGGDLLWRTIAAYLFVRV